MRPRPTFWDRWSKTFPLTVEHVPADKYLPERVIFRRAGLEVEVSIDEFRALAGRVQDEVDTGKLTP